MSNVADPLAFIKTQHPFDYLEKGELQLIAETLEVIDYVPGNHILIQDGPPGQYLYLIKEGAVRYVRDGQIIQILEEGELFGYPSFDRA